MPVVSEMVHPLSLDFASQRQVALLRGVNGEKWVTIQNKVRNLQGEKPSLKLLQRLYRDISMAAGRRAYKYGKCGRKPWKVTKQVEAYVVRRLRYLRTRCVCTATTIQRDLAKDMGVALEVSTIRRVLTKRGYKWLPRSQKRAYSKAAMARRLAFAEAVVRLSSRQLRERLSMAMDGVVLSLPPADPVDRKNYCIHGTSHTWRKSSEAASPALAGQDPYGGQVPSTRAVPLWGGISAGGFSIVTFHSKRKLNAAEWVASVRRGALTWAIRNLSPVKADGPWYVLCDNESFLRARDSTAAHRHSKVTLWAVPARSPDLNPIEKFWSWLRTQLRQRDLADLQAGRPPMGRVAFKARVRAICRSQRAQRVARACALGLRKVCQEVVMKKGAMARS